MSSKEIDRLEVMQKLDGKQMSQKEAARILQISTRQVKRLLQRYREYGAVGLISKQRGRKSNNQLSAETKKKALDALKSKYLGFGPTLAQEKLVENEHLQISTESVRQLMMAEGLWKARKAAKSVTHQLRERRACFGELIQIDGSPHDWFEGREVPCTLLVFIDDASGRLVHLQFVQNESFFSYTQACGQYFRSYGKPVAFYSDKHGIFRVNQRSRGASDALTQFGRAMQELDIQIICANTPQAKGRVERVILTLQDRLPKEMRLRQISSWQAGNAFLPTFIQHFNQRFALPPRSSVDAHRPLTPQDDLDTILTWQEQRIVSKNLTVQFDRVVYQIQTDRPSYALRKASITVCLDAHHNVTLLYKGKLLTYNVFHQQAKQSEVVSSKDLDQRLPRSPAKPAPDHPWRKYGQFKNPRSVSAPRGGDTSTLKNR
jgi:transposase